MIIEYSWSDQELRRKKCYGCTWLRMIDDWYGVCGCQQNKVKFRERKITDKKCTYKSYD
jgi:hypothetical protein